MTQPVDVLAPAIGACLNCRSLFLVTFDTPRCILCGSVPTYTLAFSPAEQVAATPEPEPVFVPEPPAARLELGEEEPLDVLLDGIASYLGDQGITQDDVATWLMRMGADPEAAATAVGRLAAVRDLIAQLAQPQESQLIAAEELVSPLAAAAAAAPSSESPPPQEEEDRPIAGSP
jgi:hypothetical protein